VLLLEVAAVLFGSVLRPARQWTHGAHIGRDEWASGGDARPVDGRRGPQSSEPLWVVALARGDGEPSARRGGVVAGVGSGRHAPDFR
jgi:hypothetical protein